jgi:sulfonate transport system substrate-binding protein
MPTTTTTINRRLFLKGVAGVGALTGLAACATAEAGPTLALTDPLPAQVPPGTSLRIASANQQQKLSLELSGLIDDLTFDVPEWPNISAGPEVINAYRAESLELGSNAGIPPIQARYQGLDARIVAVKQSRTPIYLLATAPGSSIAGPADFRGKKLAFSQGQAQGVVLLRVLAEAGIGHDEVELVELTSLQFLTALQSRQVDVAPLGATQVPKYLEQYASDGARALSTDVLDLLTVLWAPTAVLQDAGKAAAIASYIPLWKQSAVWTWENPQEWAQKYYVDTQNLTLADAEGIIELLGEPLFPPSWDEAIAWEQETVELLAAGGFVQPFDASTLFDRRFEPIATDAVAEEYRS